MLERLQTLPIEFLNREAVALALAADSLRDINGLNAEQIGTLIESIKSKELSELIERGEITVAMIRPQAFHNKVGLSDLEMEQTIIAEIQAPLEVAISFAVVFDEETVDQFYGGAPKERQLKSEPYTHKHFNNRWDEFVAMMKSGPTTVLLLHSGDGQAIQHWRKLVGHWNIVDTDQPDTIRGKYGKDNYNNLIHGSDSPESVKNELGLITQQLARTYKL